MRPVVTVTQDSALLRPGLSCLAPMGRGKKRRAEKALQEATYFLDAFPLKDSMIALIATNRLIPVHTFGTRGAGTGIDLESYIGANSAYRSEAALRRIYGKTPTNTVNPTADYMDQTDVAALQRAALAAGKKHIILVVFDGM